MLRVGRPPKRLALYRGAPGLVVDGKTFNSFEIFSRSGQCVLYGVHPQTGQPYRWLTDSPTTIAPVDLPIVGSEQIVALIEGLQQLDPVTRRDTVRARGHKKSGITAGILHALPDVEDAPAEAAADPHGRAAWQKAQHDGRRRLALAMRGYSDAAIFDALDDAYYLVNDFSIEEATAEVSNAIRWARERAGRRRDDRRGHGAALESMPQPGTGVGGAHEPPRYLRSHCRHRLEYVRISEKDNRIVSYQFAIYNPRIGKRASGLITPKLAASQSTLFIRRLSRPGAGVC